MTEWKQVLNNELNARELRANYIVGNGLFLEAIVMLVITYIITNHLIGKYIKN
ncbi:hypothetical protein ABER75_10940 [Niallia taxi]|uniref:hypothetical protein n=1 Tax=Niallia taxi TaxID=2499688 RepID=UPI003D2A8D50